MLMTLDEAIDRLGVAGLHAGEESGRLNRYYVGHMVVVEETADWLLSTMVDMEYEKEVFGD